MPGWLGTDAHLVDGTWIGTERSCAEGDDGLECRTVVEAGLRALPTVRTDIAAATLADLPSEFRTPNGEIRQARVSRTLDTYQALVLDLADGTREVEGFLCYLAHGQDGRLVIKDVQCRHADLIDWRERTSP